MAPFDETTPREGRVLIRHGNHVELLAGDGALVHCPLQRRHADLFCGDRVHWRPAGDEGKVVKRLPRASVLTRASRGKPRPLAANVDWVGVVVAPEPGIDPEDIDRYLIACELSELPARLLINKADTLDSSARRAIEERLADILALVPHRFVSSREEEDWQPLLHDLAGRTAVLVGSSGAGKTSLTNALSGESSRTGELTRSGHGRHTTSTTRLIPLPEGGALIDSPGVRAFALDHLPPEQVVHGFTEFAPYTSECRFRDCRHLDEPDCAVQAAVAAGTISERRYRHFRRLRLGEGS